MEQDLVLMLFQLRLTLEPIGQFLWFLRHEIRIVPMIDLEMTLMHVHSQTHV